MIANQIIKLEYVKDNFNDDTKHQGVLFIGNYIIIRMILKVAIKKL